MYNTKDNTLGPNTVNPFSPYQIYPTFEGDLALGQNGSQIYPNITLPNNYVDINITEKIPFNTDANGDKDCDDWRLLTLKPVKLSCMITQAGESHYGYFGFRDADNKTRLIDIGAMDILVSNLKNDTKFN